MKATHPCGRRRRLAALLFLCSAASAASARAQAPPDTIGVPDRRVDLGVVKSASELLPAESSPLQWVVTLENAGPDSATRVMVDDKLPAGLTLSSWSASQGTYNAATGRWAVGGVAASDSAVLVLDTFVNPGTAGTTITNVVRVASVAEGDSKPANDADTVVVQVPGADLAVHKAASDGAPNEGHAVSWTVGIANLGPDSVGAVAVTDTLPSGVTWVAHVASRGTWDPATGVWALGGLAPGDTAALVVETTVDPGTAGTTITNEAAIAGASLPDPVPGNDAAAATIVPRPPPVIALRSVEGPATVSERQTGVGISVALENLGPDPVRVDTLVLQFTRNVAGDLDGEFVVAGGAPGDTIAAGATGLFALAVDLGPGVTAGPVSVDARAVATDGGSGTTVEDDGADATHALVVQTAPDLEPEPGTLSPLAVALGSAASSLEVEVTNAGEAEATLGPASRLRIAAAADTLDAPIELGEGRLPRGGTLLRFGPFAVPSSFPEGVHAVLLDLVGQDSNGASYAQVVALADSVIVASAGVVLAASQAPAVARPGDPDVALFTLAIAHSLTSSLSLEELHFANATAGPGAQIELDAELGVLTLWRDDGDGGFDPRRDIPAGQATAAGGAVSFRSIALPLLAPAAVHVTCAPTLAARDGDLLDLVLPGPASVVFDRPVTFFNGWPLDPAGGIGVDGMVALQIASSAVPASELFADSSGFLALDVVVPANGYEADTLEALRIVNLEDAQAQADIASVTVWVDGGDGSWGGDDVPLGDATWNGAWELGGLGLSVAPGGRRLFASIGVAPAATPGRRVRLAIERDGLAMASANDGPVDAPASCPVTRTIRDALSEVAILPRPQSPVALLPGAPGVEVFRFDVVNRGAVPETLVAFTVQNSSVGPGTQSQLDASWLPIEARTGPIDARSATFGAGQATFALDLEIAAGDTAAVTLSSGASTSARDSDRLDLLVEDAGALAFSRAVGVAGPFPLDPPGRFPVDGMSADQIAVPNGSLPDLLTGSARNLSFELVLPANGYELDTLRWLNVTNEAAIPAAPGIDVERLEAWADDGDGAFDPSTDGRLGELVFTGARWELSGLLLPVPLSGAGVFVSSDIMPDAREGRGLRLALPAAPDPGVGMQTANDGPVDRVVASPNVQTISAVDRITVGAVAIAPGATAPGASGVPLVRLRVSSSYLVPKELVGLTIANVAQGGGSQGDLDAETALLTLRADAPDGTVLATGQFAGGQTSFAVAPGAFGIDPDEARELWVTADVSLLDASDGDVLGALVPGAASLSFEDGAAVVGNFPLDSGAGWTVDGMLAAQVTNHGAPVATIGPGEGPVLALDVVIPSNGYAADVLQGLKLEVGGANPADTSDVDELRLWRDDGDGAFDPGTDASLGPLTFLAGQWSSAALSEPVPPGGARLFVSVTSSPALADSADVQLRIPVGQITMDSGNDGPRDVPIENPDVLRLSNAALLATVTLSPPAVTVGAGVTARMQVENRGDSTITGVAPSALTFTGTGGLAILSGPLPPSFDLAPGQELEFQWSCRADSAGSVRASGRASGLEQGSGLVRQSLLATSNELDIFVPAPDVAFSPVESMPFSINRGQADVVPLSLTLAHGGGPGASAVRLRRFEVRLEDGLGADVVPADLLSRVVVREGTTRYLEKSGAELETSGGMLDLALDDEVVIDAGGQATLSLSLDVADSTWTSEFRTVILADSSFDAFDATSGLPIAVRLVPSESYPIQSGLARIAAPATRLDLAAASGSADSTVGQGEQGVALLALDLSNPGPAALGAPIRVSAFDVALFDGTGAPVADPSTVLRRIRVLSGAVTHAEVLVGSGTTIAIALASTVNVPAAVPLRLDVGADLAPAAALGSYRLRLGDEALLDARDGNTGAAVAVVYATDPLEGRVVIVKARADSVAASGRSLFPPSMAVGSLDVSALGVVLSHPGGPETSALRCDSLTIQCRDAASLPLVPAAYLDRARVLAGTTEVGALGDLPVSGGELTVPLAGVVVAPGDSVLLEVRCDVEVTATPTLIALTVAADGIHARDEDLGTPAAVGAAIGAEFPLTSGFTQLRSPARELRASFEDRMPSVLAADGGRLEVAALGLRNASGATSGTITVDHLVLSAADRDFLAISLGDVVSAVRASIDGRTWAEATGLAPGAFTARLDAAQPLVLSPDAPVAIEIDVTMHEGSEAASFRIGVAAEGVGVVQPPSPLLSVSVLPQSGSFPFWTSSGTLSARSLAESWSNFPNPFGAGRETTTFTFYLVDSGRVSLGLWSSRGERVLTLLDRAPLAAGLHQNRTWDGRNGNGDVVRSGVYVAELVVDWDAGGSERVLRKVAVVR